MRRIYFFLAAALLLFGIGSCAKDEFKSDTKSGLTFTITTPAPQEVVPTKASDAQETRIELLALFFYEGNSIAKVIELDSDDLGTPTQTSSTNYKYTITLDAEKYELTTAMNYLYAIANYGKSNFGTVSLDNLKTLTRTQMDAALVDNNNTLLDMTETSMLLTGKFSMSNASGTSMPTGAIALKEKDNPDNLGTIHLRRIASKTTFTFTAASGITFTPTSYKVCNYSRSCTLFERDCWSPNYSTGTVATSDHAGNDKFIDIDGKSGDMTTSNGSTSFTFYMQENAQTTLPASASISSQADREKCTYASTTSDDRTFDNAPEDATYVVVKGNYSDSSYSGEVQYTIHLGDFGTAVNNFSVRRNTKYKYNITVAGVSKIVAEVTTNVESQPGAEGDLISKATALTDLTLDSHYETVMVKLPKQAISKYSLRISTPYSSINYNSTESGQTAPTSSDDINWVKFCAPASTTAFTQYPGDANFMAGDNTLTNIMGLIESLASYTASSDSGSDPEEETTEEETPKYYVEGDDYLYVQANVDEYYYAGKELSTFIEADNREMTLALSIAVSTDGHSSLVQDPTFSLKQRSIKTVYNSSASLDNPVGLECSSEFENPTACESGEVSDKQPVKTMDGLGTSKYNGWSNFYNEIITSTSWSTYISTANNGHFNSSQYVPATAMTQANKYAIYQCLSKNRDEDGDGVIDDSEKKWYLPASQQYFHIWYGTPALESDAVLSNEHYYTSTGGAERVFWAQQGAVGGHDDENLTSYVRCVRNLKTTSGAPTIPYTYYSATRTVSLNNLNQNALRSSGSQTGEYLEGHLSSDAQNILPEAFQIATDDLSVPVGTSSVTETVYAPQISSPSYDGSSLSFTIDNYSTLTGNNQTTEYTSGSTAGSISSMNVTDIPVSSWADNSATVEVYSEKTVDGSVVKSGNSVVTVTRTATGTSSDDLYDAELGSTSGPQLSFSGPYSSLSSSDNVSFTINNFSNYVLAAPSLNSISARESKGNKLSYNNNSFSGVVVLSLTFDNYSDYASVNFTTSNGTVSSYNSNNGEVRVTLNNLSATNDSATLTLTVTGTNASNWTSNSSTISIVISKSGGNSVTVGTPSFTAGSTKYFIYYKVGSGSATNLTADSVSVPISDISFGSGNTATISVYDDSNNTSTIIVRKGSTSYTYSASVTNGDDTETTTSGYDVSTNYNTYSGSISNVIDGDTSSSNYWWSSESQSTGKYVLLTFNGSVKLKSLVVTSNHDNDYPHSNNELQVSSDNSTWTTVGTFPDSKISTFTDINKTCQYVRIYATSDKSNWLQISEITVAFESDSQVITYKSTFTISDMLTKSYCALYYSEEDDQSDLGEWRIPNNRELLLMFSNVTLTEKSASRTVFDRGSYGLIPYYYYNDAITSSQNYATDFKIRCVRDVTPTSSN